MLVDCKLSGDVVWLMRDVVFRPLSYVSVWVGV